MEQQLYEDRIIVFIDILGFSNRIMETVIDDQEQTKQTQSIKSFIELIQNDFEISDKSKEKTEFASSYKSSFIATQCSDSLFLSYKYDEESAVFYCLIHLYYFCFDALRYGFLVRGSIVRGQVYHTKNMIFGPGLVEAVEKEKALVSYPRIVLGQDILDIVQHHHARHHGPDEELEYIKTLIEKDFDGLYYINYFTGMEGEFDGGVFDLPIYLLTLKKKIEELSETHPAVLSKKLWLKEKYNRAIVHYQSIIEKKQEDEDYQDVANAIHAFKPL